MRRPSAAAGSALFFAVAPGVVAGVIPWAITGWETDAEWWLPLRVLGGVLIVAGGAVLVSAFARFVREGLGTPAPVAPTEHLVVGGLYRYVRNVMYIAVTTTILGQALLFGSVVLLVWAAVVWAAMAAFVRVVRGADARRPVRRAVRGVPPRRTGVVAAAQRETIAELTTCASTPLPTPSVMVTVTLRVPALAYMWRPRTLKEPSPARRTRPSDFEPSPQLIVTS